MKKLIILLPLAALLLLAQPAAAQYKIYFNKILCMNTWNTIMPSEVAGFIEPVMDKFPDKRSMPANIANSDARTKSDWYAANPNYLSKDRTFYYPNMSMANFPDGLLNMSKFTKVTGKAGANSNDRFYMTYKEEARQGMVLPVRGGDKDLFRFALWLPQAADGNPALAGQDQITYYVWEADIASGDNNLGNIVMNLKDLKNKGPQLALVIRAKTGSIKEKAIKYTLELGRSLVDDDLSAVYVVEYEVK